MIRSKIFLIFGMAIMGLMLLPVSFSDAQESQMTYFEPHEGWKDMQNRLHVDSSLEINSEALSHPLVELEVASMGISSESASSSNTPSVSSIRNILERIISSTLPFVLIHWLQNSPLLNNKSQSPHLEK